MRVHIRCIERVFVYKVRAAGCVSASCLALYGNSVFVSVSVSVSVSASISASVSVTASVSPFHSRSADGTLVPKTTRSVCACARALPSVCQTIHPSVRRYTQAYVPEFEDLAANLEDESCHDAQRVKEARDNWRRPKAARSRLQAPTNPKMA